MRNSSSNCTGCLLSASYSDEPLSISARTELTSVVMRGFLLPLAMISIELTIGTPAFIIVASWRLNTAMSSGLMRLPAAPPNSGLPLGLTTFGVMPWRRSSARSMFAFLACCSPFILVPRLSVPSQTNTSSGLARRTAAVLAVLAAVRVTDMA